MFVISSFMWGFLGKMFPTIGDVHLAPFTDEQLYMEQFTKANFW